MADRGPAMPFGHNKGQPLSQIPTKDLEKTREWCRDKEDQEGADFSRLINQIDDELSERMGLPLGLDEEDAP